MPPKSPAKQKVEGKYSLTRGRPVFYHGLRKKCVLALRKLRQPAGKRKKPPMSGRGVSRKRVSLAELRQALGCNVAKSTLMAAVKGLKMTRIRKKRPNVALSDWGAYTNSQNSQGG